MSIHYSNIEQPISEVLILVHKWKSNLGTFDIDTPIKLKEVLDVHNGMNDKTSITIHTGPGHYQTSRKGIAIGFGCLNVKNCNLYGFNILTDFLALFGNKCFYNEGKNTWTYDTLKVELHKSHEVYIDSSFVGNINAQNNQLVDCSIEHIWQHLNRIKTNILQPQYYDKYNKVILPH